MPSTRSSHRIRKNLYALLAFYLFTMFLLSLAWEFKLGALTMGVFGLPYDGDFESSERWRFVLTSTTFALLSMVMPFLLVRRLLQRLQFSYRNLVASQAQSEALARHDPLSGLLNRRVFHEQLSARLNQPGQATAVFLIDLDRFKQVNDTLGHAAGDLAICTVADRLREATSGWQPSLARLGGDEFALAVSGQFTRADLAALADAVLTRIAAPVPGAPLVSLSATLGVAVAPMDGVVAETLLQRADSAMYRGKHTGRAVFHFYEASFEREQREQALFEDELRHAIDHGQIQPFYQPIVSLPEQQLVGFEVLARWAHPERGIVLPVEFVAVAEQLGLIKPLTEALLRQAFVQAAQWPGALTLAVNMSASMIESLDLPHWLQRLADEGGFPLNRIEVEVTENTLVANVANARHNLERLRAMGVTVALDDFGTGYSGLYHLTQLAIDKIKIDRSFLDTSLENQNEMVRAILALGKSLRMQITAEGVEHERLAEWLAEHDCDFAQGYLFGRPLPMAQVMAVVQAQQQPGRLRAAPFGVVDAVG